MSEDWEKVAPAGEDWEPVSPAERPAPDVGEALPEAFMGRLKAGQALSRIAAAGIKEAGNIEPGTPTGLEDATLNHLIELGVFHDPAKGRPGPLQMANEAVIMPSAQLWQGITRATAAGLHAAGGAYGQLVEEFGGSQGDVSRARRDVIGMGEYAMIEAGMGRFARPGIEGGNAVADRTVGSLPAPADFSNGAKVLTGQTGGMPSLFAKFGETGRAEKNSSIEAPPGTQSPLDQVSTRPEPSGSSTTRPTTPLSTTEGPVTTFGDFELGSIDGSSNKKILQGSNDYKALLASAEKNKPKLADALQRVTDGIDGASVYGVRVKDEPGLREKIETKGRAPSTISDYLGGRIVADTPSAMNAILSRFEGTGAVIESENFVHTPKAGYRAYHLQVGLGDGTSAEIQIVPKPIADKIDETHAIRQPFKRMAEASPEGMARFKEAMERAVKISDDAWSDAKGWSASNYTIRDINNPVETTQENLRRMWSEDGIHPAEAVHDAEADAFVKHQITAKNETIEATTTPANYTKDENGTIRYGDNHALVIREVPRAAAGSRGMFASDFSEEAGGKFVALRSQEGLQQTLLPSGVWVSKPQKPALFDTAAEAEAAAKQALGLKDSGPIPKDWDVKPEEMEQAFGGANSLSAAMTPPEDIPLNIQPAAPGGTWAAATKAAADKLFDVGHDIQMKLTPMARGSVDSMATVKDYMNATRRAAWDASRIDDDLMKRFTPEQRARMWTAMDEESTSLRLGEPASAREHQGLATLEPEERAAVLDLDARQQNLWFRARDLGMVEGDGIPMHAPRMVINIPKGDAESAFSLDATGYDMRTRTPGMRQRKHMEVEETERAAKAKYGEEAVVARDIRAVNIGTSQLEQAIAGRQLIENIKDVGKRTGEDAVAEGWQPGKDWFTIEHPAFKTWRPRFKDGEVVKDANGEPVMEQVPIYVRGDFEGPLRSAMWGQSGDAYKAVMALKGKTMGLIMNSPAIHNLVELGRAFPAMPLRIFKAYFDGNRAKNDVAVMHEAIDNGLVPIGHRFFNQDINAVMESPDLTPGRSWTAKIAAAVPGMFDEAAGTAVKRAIDKAGDFWHNTLLWDRIADLQMGLYVNLRGDLVGKGFDPPVAAKMAAHFANRYAGALPKEAMSEAATKAANLMFFSRSFTFGNLGVMKDMLTGLPKDVLAQIERDASFKAGSIDGAGEEGAVQQAVTSARSMARRKAMSVVALDIGLMYVGNSVLQSAFNVMLGSSISEEENGYIKRARDLMNDAKVHPLSLLNPFNIAGKLSATSENEPGKGDRVMIGTAKDGTAIYARNPVGKIGEEFTNWFGSPLDMLKKKEGTIARPLMQVLSNDAGFGRKIYDPDADSAAKYAGNIWAIVKHLVGSQLPEGQIGGLHDLVTGEGDKKVNLLRTFGPVAGVTFSKGAPGGPAVGEMYHEKSQFEFRVQQAMPDVRRQIQRGDISGAKQAMTSIGMDGSYQNWVVRTTLDPKLRLSSKSQRDFYFRATDEQKARMDRAMGR